MAEHFDIPGAGHVIGESTKDKRDTNFHKKIVKIERVPGYKAHFIIELECGHQCRAFGNMEHANGVILCQPCIDAAHRNS